MRKALIIYNTTNTVESPYCFFFLVLTIFFRRKKKLGHELGFDVFATFFFKRVSAGERESSTPLCFGQARLGFL